MMFRDRLTEQEWDLVFRFHKMMEVLQYPKDFEAACKEAHEVRK